MKKKLNEDDFHDELAEITIHIPATSKDFKKHVFFRADKLYHEKYSHLPIEILNNYKDE